MQGRLQGGLGLGLAIVKELVELHGGTVRADSRGDGLGTTVTVALPIPVLLVEPKESEAEEPATLANAVASRADEERTALEGLHVLVVEDEADGREMLAMVFERRGAKVSAVASAADAMEVLRKATPDVLVCDIGLLGEDGHEFIRRVRAFEGERGGRVPALALTAYAEASDRRKAMAAGFDLHVSKPVAPADLVAKVALLTSPRGRQRT
jgi:CheY-like chemotaxis protein